MKKSHFLFLFVIITNSIVGQSNIRLNNYWGELHYINPAAVYDKYDAVFSMAARKQWAGIHGAPTTFFASGSTYLEKYNTQLGLYLLQDQVGYTSTNNLNLSYAYAIMFQQEWQLHLGFAGNYQSVSYDLSNLSLLNNSDPLIYQRLVSKRAFNADIGAEVTNKYLKVGLVSQNLLSLFTGLNPLQTNTNYIYARYYQNTNNIVNVGAGICGIQYANIYQAEFNVTGYFKFKQENGLTEKTDVFDIGVFYRTRSEVGMIIGFNLSESIHLSYSYDYHLGGISLGSYGTNELMIAYNLMKKPVCHNCWY